MRQAIVAVVALAVVAPCGGDSQKPDSPMEKWRAAADAACGRAERAIRDGGRPRDVGDLERVMVRVGDIVTAATGEIRELKVPEGEKERVAPVLEQLTAVRERVDGVLEAVESENDKKIGDQADSLRIDGSAYERAAEKAGLKRCGRRAVTDALADELCTPGWVAATASAQVFLDTQVRRLRRLLAATPDPEARAKLWDQMGDILDGYGYETADMPLRLEQIEDRFGFVTMDLEEAMNDAAYHLRRGTPAALTKARRREQAAFKGFGKLRAQTRAQFKAAGPAGREALERVGRPGGGGAAKGENPA